MKKLIRYKTNRKQQGYALLEYAAGAAIIAGILWVALSAMGSNLARLFDGIGTWAQNRTTQLQP